MSRLILLTLLTFLARPSFAARKIVGGSVTTIGRHPYMVSIRAEPDVHICGGSVITKRHVLTAAHCLVFYHDIFLVVGSSCTNGNGTRHEVESLLPHESFEVTSPAYDIGLVKIVGEFRFASSVRPVALGWKEVPPGAKARACGWGTTEVVRHEEGRKDGRPRDTPLSVVSVPILSRERCQRAFKRHAIRREWICARDPHFGKDTCQGDSGGPLIYRNEQIGIIGWGIGCGHKYPGIYTKVLSYRTWIMKNTHS